MYMDQTWRELWQWLHHKTVLFQRTIHLDSLQQIMLTEEYGISQDILFAHQGIHGTQIHPPKMLHMALQKPPPTV